MSIEFIDGFDHYDNTTNITRKWDACGGFDVGTGRYGTGTGNAIAPDFGGLRRVMGSAQQTWYIGFAWKCTSLGDYILAQFLDGGTIGALGTTQCELRVTSAGALRVTRNGTSLDLSSFTAAANAWYYIEFKLTISSLGAYEVRVNGATVLSASSINTQNTANSSANQLFLNNSNRNNYYDDLYLLNTSGSVNNNFLGECRIFTSLPTGDDASFKQWTPSTGTNHFANVDDSPDPNDDTDYNSSATVGQIDLFTYPSISTTGTIACVQTVLVARKDDAGARQICEECRSGGTNYDGGNTFTLASGYSMYRQIRETNPATSAAWTVSGVNSAEFGAKVLA